MKWLPQGPGRRNLVKVVVISAAVLLMLVLSVARNSAWSTEAALWEDTGRKSSQKARPAFNLGLAYLNASMWSEGEAYMRKSLELYPAYNKARYYHAEALYRLGRYGESIELLKEVERIYREVLPGAPPEIRSGVALALSEEDIYNNMASCYYNLGDLKQAEEYYRRAVSISPGKAVSREGLISVLLDAGRPGEAASEIEALLDAAPDGYHRRPELQLLLEEIRGEGR